MKSMAEVASRVRMVREDCHERDSTMEDIRMVREGRIAEVFPSMFNEYFPAPVIANFIDTACKDVAESLAPLPSVNCGAANMVSDAARSRSAKRTMGAHSYLESSEVERLMYTAAENFASYGFLVSVTEPDFEKKMPRIMFEDSRGSYYELDRTGRCVWYAKLYRKPCRELCILYPDLAHRITGADGDEQSEALLELYHYRDDHQSALFMPQRSDLVLQWTKNRLGECPVAIAERPHVTDKPRGQFDDVLWPQVMRNRFMMMAAQAAEQAVEAPLAVPPDVQDISVGGMQVLRSNAPEKIKKILQELPQAAFVEGQALDQEMRNGARYPGVRTGNLDASIITGQGVKALEGGFDSQIRGAQSLFATMFKRVLRLCFMMDEKFWGDTERSIIGQKDGVPYDIKWKPSRDIAGDYSVSVEYGFAAGLDPNRATVLLLQVLGGGLVSRDFVRRQLPFSVNVVQEEQRIEIEGLRESLVQAMAAYAQSIPILAQNGMDPGQVLEKVAAVIDGRSKGKPLEKVVSEAFAPQQQPAAPEGGPTDPLAAIMGGGAGAPEGMQSNGLPVGTAPGQATMGPGGAPDLMTLLAGLNSGGGPAMSASVQRRIPA